MVQQCHPPIATPVRPNWASIRQRLLSALFILCCSTTCEAESQPRFVPDPLTVTRHGPAWKFPQEGWTVIHIEGTPYERGFQHGRLLAREIVEYCNTIAKVRSEDAPENAWRDLRLFTNALFLRKFNTEYLREMQGIADGAAAAGARLDGRLLDLIDIAVINADVELGFLEAALEATATGIDRETFRGRHGSPLRAMKHDRCSAFLATGTATANGKIVAGHVTMSDLPFVRYFNIWLDIEPADGHRMVFQTFPGAIQSGLDYYINSAGLIIAETTIQQTRFEPNAEMLASRIRRCAQYGDSIDRCIEILKSSNNGLYTNEWLFGDLKSNEIAMFELGNPQTRLWRSSRDEWVAGTKGFYWGCNNIKDVSVYKDTVPDLGAKPANLVFYPHRRDEAWLKLFHKRKGTISEAFGFEAFSTPLLIGFPTCDAKFTTAEMASELKTWALFGPPLGRTWVPSQEEREQLSTVQPLVAHDWTVLDVRDFSDQPQKVMASAARKIVDADPFPKKEEPLHVEFDAQHPFVWRGTLLAMNDSDIWLAAAFAEYEKVVALEQAVIFHDESHSSTRSVTDDSASNSSDEHSAQIDDVGREGRDLVQLALFRHESNWLTATRRNGHDVPLVKTIPSFENADWYRIASGKGVMLLAAIRKQVGTEKFIHFLDDFGQAHAGQQVTTEEFRKQLEKQLGAEVVTTFDHWTLHEVADEWKSHNPWTIFSHEVEPAQILIVYGTLKNRSAQKEAAEHLRSEVARRFANFWTEIRSDVEMTDEELKSHHLLLVGTPDTNSISGRVAQANDRFPVKFTNHSFAVGDEIYAHPESYVIAAGQNPWGERFSAVMFAGLNAASTWRSVRNLNNPDEPDAQLIVSAQGKRLRKMKAPAQ